MTTQSKEQRVLVVMRKVLSSIIKDTTPMPGMKHVLSSTTIEDVRNCLGLITARENELQKQQTGQTSTIRPRYIDQPETTKVVAFDLGKPTKRDDS